MARFRPSPETFTVEEVPAYLPCGAGDHTYLWIEKRSLTTLDAIGLLAQRLGVPSREVGYAGMKDRHATTRQWLSAPRIDVDAALGASDDAAAPQNGDGGTIGSGASLKVLRAEKHGNKLRIGHLRGNRFVVTVEDVADLAQATQIVEGLRCLSREGLPNRYGDQRFGVTSGNVKQGIAIVRGEVKARDHRRRKLLLSAVQSAIFNEVLAERQARGQLRHVLTGDILQKTDSGGVFFTDDPEQDQERVATGAVVITGPMPGSWARAPAEGSQAREVEDQAMAIVGVTRADLAAFGKDLPGTRRPLWVPVELDRGVIAPTTVEPLLLDAWDAVTGRLALRFQLPSGTYATVLLAALGVAVESHRRLDDSSSAADPTLPPEPEAPVW